MRPPAIKRIVASAGGAGLGLASASKTAQAMGRALLMEDSRPGGLAVRLILPKRTAAG